GRDRGVRGVGLLRDHAQQPRRRRRGSGVPMSDDPVIELHGAAFGYEDRTVVGDIDLTVRRGEVVAVLGPNGSGKSTLVKGLLGLADQHAGSARVLGSPIASRPAQHGIGYVPQRHTLASAVTATASEI